MRTFQLLGTKTLVLDEGEAMRHTLERMGGHDLAWAMSKTITASDTKKGQSRLLIPKEKGLWDQLSEEEQMELRRRGYVEVEVVDPRGNRHEMKLSQWPAGRNLVLNSGWNDLVRDNKLEAGIHCTLWSFRVGLRLCFALCV
ncbi:putative B3 domain-containing protein At3g49610 [Vitis vinifera]|nr:putative B3 domain-containing protein At3g49610 [Vitis vinifera]